MRWILGLFGAGLLALLTIAGSDRLFSKTVPLDQRLVSSNETIRKKAQQELLGLGGDAKHALTAQLIPLFSANDAFVRKWSAIAVALMGPAAQEAIPVLLHGVSDPEKEVAQACRVALSEIGTPDAQQLPILLQGLGDPQEAVRCEAAAGISKMGPAAKDAIPIFIEQTRSSQAPECVLETTARLINATPESAPQLVVLLRDPEVAVRRRASHVLSLLENKTPEVLTALLETLASDEDRRVRDRAAHGLGLRQAPDRGLLPTLMATALHSKNELARRIALEQLHKTDRPIAEHLRILRKVLLQDKSAALRLFAAQGLAELGPAARPALSALFQSFDDADSRVRETALIALRSMVLHSRELLPAIARLQRDDDAQIRCLAAEQLVEMGAWDRVSVNGLTHDLANPGGDGRCAGEALAMDGHFNPEVAVALIRLLQTNSLESRRRAAGVLMNLGTRAKEALPALAQAQHDGVPGAHIALRAIRESLVGHHRPR